MSTALSILALLAAGYAVLLLAVFLLQSRMVFFPDIPSRALGPGPDSIGLAHERLRITTEDGVELDAWYLPAPAPRGWLLFFHGNAGNISHRLDSLRQFHALGLATLIFDYRGYGQSGGRVSEQGIYRDAEAAWRYLTGERRVPAEKIVLFGRSMGAAAAAYTASRYQPGALILESGFVSAPDLGARLYPWLPVRWLARIHLPTGDFLRAVTCPVLVVHSRDDEIVPFAQGLRLYELAPGSKRLLELRGGHNDGFVVSGRHYLDGLDSFLAGALGD